jgi:hypothetical protein
VFYVLFVCKCVLYYCHRVSTQLQLTSISYYIISLLLQKPTTSMYLGRMNSLHAFQSFTIYFNLILPPVHVCLTSGIPVSGFPLITLHACLLSFACYMASPPYSSFFGYPKKFSEKWKLRNSALCSFLHPCHFLLLRPKYFPQYPVLKHLSLREKVSPSHFHVLLFSL